MDNNFILYSFSTLLSYYLLNACDKRNDIIIVLMYNAIKFCIDNGCENIYLDNYYTDYQDQKNQNIAMFKYGFCNKLITNYYY